MHSTWNIHMLARLRRRGTIGKYQYGVLKVARKAFNIGEVRKPVCCHGNKIVEHLSYWILPQKNQTILMQIGWYILVYHIWLKFGWVNDFITWLICILKKKEYIWNKLKNS